MLRRSATLAATAAILAAVLLPAGALAQAGAASRPAMMGPPPVVSPERMADGRITFRIRAPDAHAISVTGDVGEGLPGGLPRPPMPPPLPPAGGPGAPRAFVPPPPVVILARGDDGVWTGTTPAPVRAGAYRYVFNVDGVRTIDQGNMRTSPSQNSVQSLLVVPGDFSEDRAVPHGAVSEINYEPTSYDPGTQRRLWVYTPPGYETSTHRYPVLYLLHGGGDTAESWATVGRANFIIDNLLAQGRAVPFIVVMMSGWTPRGPQSESIDAGRDPFNAEFTRDIVPMVEHRFRVQADPAHRALSGLSMGGFQTLTLGMKNIDLFGYVMPMSTGWFTDAERDAFIAANRDAVMRADRTLTLFRWGYGTTDIARENGLASMTKLRAAGMRRIETIEVEGGHTWTTWRTLLHDYAPRLFR